MAKLLYKLGRWSFRRKWVVIVAWVIIVAGVGGSAGALQRGFNDIFNIPGTASEAAADSLVRNFPDQRNPLTSTGVTMVFAAPEGQRLDEPRYVEAIDRVIADIDEHVPGVIDRDRFGNPVTLNPQLQKAVIDQSVGAGLPEETAKADAENLALLSPDGRIGYTSFSLDVPLPADVTDEQRATIRAAMDVGREAGLQVETGGPAFGDPLVIKSTSEIIGLGVAFLVLLFTFGSLVAAGLPLITAVVGISVGSSAILIATHFAPLNNVTPVLAVMLGLAVGVDYTLFILSRYRAERNHGHGRNSPEHAAGMAVGTAGSAVVFAGLTVIIALVALTMVRIPFLSWMGVSAAFTVAVAVAVALTLLPALLGMTGRFAFAGRVPGLGGRRKKRGDAGDSGDAAEDATTGRRSVGRTWVTFVHRVPALVLTVVVLGLSALSYPVLDLQMALPSDSTFSKSSTQRKSADLLAEGFGEGINSPFLMIIDAHDVNPDAPILRPLVEAQRAGDPEGFNPENAAAMASYAYVAQRYNTNPDIKHVQIIGLSEDTRAAQLLITPRSGPADPVTSQLLGSLRASDREIEDATGIDIGVTGLTPIQRDVTKKLAEAMPVYLAVVVGLAIVLLLVVFRSIMVPVIAGLGFLLSVGAAFGVTVLFWQEGLWGIVDTPAPIISFMPIFLIGVTFGLAMDYQMFLVTRMREHWIATGGKRTGGSRYNAVEESVIEGFSMGARVVTSAALIMIAVFAAFIDQPLPFIKIFGFALGAGVLFDAFFIRMGLVPAAMFLLGRATWWMPKWLDRILPTLDIEGAVLEEQFDGPDATPNQPVAVGAGTRR
ncbi:MMPL family transporter [Corynebacterium pygosceleis]|uniref:MMPL family transporter n=1 Tax=Corynebacterium pygosceleis TaxID=2800406 RepID=A0A9Q4C8M6_9CORY|nr:MMPL family transporter [Corynebacterium pygosceleis]MCK7637326.1 MMPL family transporter [Corynebacterium pygosceleis]MCK7675976.1 MMPL family transporter [Corynebacterium pygosceleis]MCX7445229.1 MMPL family transporter [Corynebacterium pygosceleis]MCX7468346.1 MMPL family transporter [Corynebacterium pygosceleis]